MPNNDPNSNILFIGDSLTVPIDISFENAWFTLYCDKYGYYPARVFKSGRTIQELSTNSPIDNSLQYVKENNGLTTLEFEEDALYAYDERIKCIIIRLATNDAIQTSEDNTLANFRLQYEAIINYLLGLGWTEKKIKIINIGLIESTGQWNFVSPERISSYNTEILEMCNDFGIQYLDLNSYEQSLGDFLENYTQDGLHDNLAFQPLLADWLDETLQFKTPINVTYTIL